jgi:ribosomal protein L4
MAKVIRIDDEKTRNMIELYSNLYCYPDVVKFIQDGNGNWVMSTENLANPKYLNPDPEIVSQFAIEHQLTKAFTGIIDVIKTYGVEIDYMPIDFDATIL